MMRGSNHWRRLQSATFRGCVGWSGSTCNGPVCSLGCTARPQSPQRKTATARIIIFLRSVTVKGFPGETVAENSAISLIQIDDNHDGHRGTASQVSAIE
ncbi:hypothetical protein MTP99_002272 [Tenebrio molitor]|nr:hypothetical protein MTP99_002272 [Tenebrio molitor]